MHKLLETGGRGHLDELLAEIVAKLVGHHVGEDVEHHVDKRGGEETLTCLVCLAILELLLNHAATSLIKCQNFDLFADVDFLSAEVACEDLGNLVDGAGARGLSLPLAHLCTVGNEVRGCVGATASRASIG